MAKKSISTPTKCKLELIVETNHGYMMHILEQICDRIREEFDSITVDGKHIDINVTPTVTLIYPEEEKCSI
jgi:hypothetical protein